MLQQHALSYLFSVRHDDTPILDRSLNVDPLLDRVSRLIRFDPFRPVRGRSLTELLAVLQFDAGGPDAVGAVADEVDDSVDENVDADVSDR